VSEAIAIDHFMNPFLIVFLATPFVALAARELFNLRASYRVIVIVYLILGWGLVNLAVEWRVSSLEALVQSSTSSSPGLLEKLQNDGATRVFAYYFGWVYAPIYFLLCLWVYYTARYFTRRVRKLNA
jgi:hypothetical protein